ncbi:DUF397 domain-containing protein [Lentzea terrae]|uniref:DUF397 domain-containing protein n=1 Tax=Lentzea terrae TaxID=2200761 RepID=UPI0018E5A8C0|nr:DUF397 domain-containing protein [Lentzea terrae]
MWRKSSYSGGGANECVELAVSINDIGVRDSKNPDAEPLRFQRAAFRSFLDDLKGGASCPL